jgi:hypothetical protein
MENNPYSAPAGQSHEVSTGFGSMVPQEAVEQLAKTKPWVRFLSVITFIGAGIMLLAGGIMTVAGGGMFAAASSSGGMPPALAGSMGVILAGIYVVLAILYIYPAVKLWKYAGAINRLMQSGSAEDLVAALKQQKSFWKFAGILILAMVAIYILVIIGAVVVAVIAAAAKQ